MKEFSLVDTPQAVEVSLKVSPNSVLISDNPFLSESMYLQKPIKNIEKLLSNQDSLYIGKYVSNLTREIETTLNTKLFWDYYRLKPNSLYVSNLFFRLCAGIIYRSKVLSQFINSYDPKEINMFITKTQRCDKNIVYMPARFSHPAFVLKELGFFKDIKCKVNHINYDVGPDPNETSTKNVIQRYLVYSKRLPFSMVIASILKYFSRGKPTIVVGQLNEALKEVLPSLVFNKYVYRKILPLPDFKKISISSDMIFTIEGPLLTNLKPLIKSSLYNNLKFTNEQADAVATNICGHIAAVLRETRDCMPELIKWFDKSFPESTQLYLTNALKGLLGRQVLELCRERKIKVIEFEHGVTAGISALADYKHKKYDPVAADYFLVSSNEAVLAVEKAGKHRKGFAHAIGLAEQTRIIFNKSAQRILARKRLGIKNKDKALFHVSTSPYNANYRTGLYEPTDNHIFSTDKTLIEKVYSKINYKVIFKQYPTKRYPYEPSYKKVFTSKNNVIFHKGEDFRYIRSAADIIVTMKPTSTLGWCTGLDKPIIWLDSKKIHPLTNSKLRKKFKDSFLFIDMDSKNWELKILKILNLDIKEINNIWKSKFKYRERLYNQAISSYNDNIGLKTSEVLKNIQEGFNDKQK